MSVGKQLSSLALPVPRRAAPLRFTDCWEERTNHCTELGTKSAVLPVECVGAVTGVLTPAELNECVHWRLFLKRRFFFV